MELSKNWIDLFKAFDEKKIFYWLDWGTLLGAIRNKKIFDWDHDIDISVHYDDLNKILSVLKKYHINGYKIVIQKDLPYIDNIIQIYPQLENNSEKCFPGSLDIYIYKKYNNDYVMRWLHQPQYPQYRYKKFYKLCISIIRKLNRLYISESNLFIQTSSIILIKLILFILMRGKCRYDFIPGKYFSDFIEITFYNKKFNIPKIYTEYLIYLYGKNWKIPDSNWDWRKGNPKKVFKASMIAKPINYKSIINFYRL